MAYDPRALVAVIFILFMIFSPDPQAPIVAQTARKEDVLAQERHDLGILDRTVFGDFDPVANKWLNVSGFANTIGYAWTHLDEFKTRGDKLTRYALGKDYDNKFIGKPAGSALALYHNVSGVVHGDWLRNDGNLVEHPPNINITSFAPEGPFGAIQLTSFGRNLTAGDGNIRLRFAEADPPSMDTLRPNLDGQASHVARFVTAEIGIEAGHGSSGSWQAQLNGVHFLESGHMILTTTSRKFSGLFALPHFTGTPYYYQLAQGVINRVINETIIRQVDGRQRIASPFTSHPDGSSETVFSMPQCELVLYLQQLPQVAAESAYDEQGAALLRFIEDELRLPTGASVPNAQEMRFSMVAFSPDCGYAIESKGPPEHSRKGSDHLTGIKIEVEQQQARHHILFYIIVLSGQLWLMTRQMKEASTPSMRSRVSFYTVSILALGDGFTTMTFALVSLFVPGLWVLLIATCFVAFLSVSFFGMRFLMDIWTVQGPERERQQRESRAAAAAVTANTNRQTTPVVGALSATAAPGRILDGGAVPIIIGSDQDELVDNTPSRGGLPLPVTATVPTIPTVMERTYTFGALYTRFYFLLLATLFLSLNATSWPRAFRRFYFTLLAFLYLSFWVPQIVRNCKRNCRRALRWEFVIGQSVLRLSPFAYFYGYKANVLFADVDLIDLTVLISWLWIQCVVLGSQEILGPRWFVKSAWVPSAYDYHPVLHEDEEGGNLPVGTEHTPTSPTPASKASTSKDDHDKSLRVFDCAICMHDIEVRVQGPDTAVESGLSGAGSLLARRSYMLTPCRHIFHSKCLEGWMKFRLQCPICREDLPPL